MYKRNRHLINNPYVATIFKKGIVIVTGLLSMILLTRFLGPELKGQYSYYFNLVTIGTTVLNLGISLVYPEYKRKDVDYRNMFITLTFLQFLIYLVVSVTFWRLSQSSNYAIVAILVSVSILNLQLSQLNLVENIKVHSLVTSIGALSNLVFTLIIYLFFKSSVSMALIILFLKNILLVIGSLYIVKDNFRLEGSVKVFKAILRAGFLPMLTTVLVSINYRIDIVLLNFLNVSFYEIGLYSTGVQLAEYAWMIPDIFKEVMMHKNARKDDLTHLFFSIRMANTGVLVFIIIVLLFGKNLLVLLFGSEFIGAYEITVLMFLAVPFMVYAKIISTLFIANGKWNVYFYTLLIAVFSNIVLNLAFIPMWGTIGSAIASIISYALSGLVFVYWLLRHTSAKWHELIIIRGYDIQHIFSKFNL